MATEMSDAKKVAAFASATVLALAGVKLSEQTPEQVAEFAQAASDTLGRIAKAGIVVDPRNGILYVAGHQVGNVNLPASNKLYPSSFRPQKDELGSGTELHLDDKQNTKRIESLTEMVRAGIRFILAPHAGNGINLRGQTGKSVTEWLEAAVGNKSGMS